MEMPELEQLFENYWIHKYAPQSIDEMILDEVVREKVNDFIKTQDCTSLLLAGKPGQGKTTLAKLLAKELNATVKFINASQNRGIEMVRGLEDFVNTMSIDGSLKIIILDEADRLTGEAQDALRGMIESTAAHSRFILTANEISRISDALCSRCQCLSVIPPKSLILPHIINILRKENVKCGGDIKKPMLELIDNLYPDIRNILNTLQVNVKNGILSIETTYINLVFVQELFEQIQTSDPIVIRETWIKQENEFHGDYQSLIKELHKYTYAKNNIDPIVRANIILELADGLYQSINAIDQEINFYAIILRIMKQLERF